MVMKLLRGKNAAEPVTLVLACASTFLSEKPQDHFGEKSGHLWRLKQVADLASRLLVMSQISLVCRL